MSNKVLEKFDELNKEKFLSEEEKNAIRKKIFDNLIIATDIIAMFSILIVSSIFLEKQVLKNIYNASSVLLLIFTIFVWELAYKKDDGALAICGIEMLVFSITILFMPYLLLQLNSYPLKFINIAIMIYYIVKNFIIYHKQKTKILEKNSDIKEIVKKESQDSKVEETMEKIKNDKEKIKVEKMKNMRDDTKKKTTTKTRTKSSKESKTNKKKTTETKKKLTSNQKSSKQVLNEKENIEEKSIKKKNATKKKSEPKQENSAPKKRGRPRKEKNAE